MLVDIWSLSKAKIIKWKKKKITSKVERYIPWKGYVTTWMHRRVSLWNKTWKFPCHSVITCLSDFGRRNRLKNKIKEANIFYLWLQNIFFSILSLKHFTKQSWVWRKPKQIALESKWYGHPLLLGHWNQDFFVIQQGRQRSGCLSF
jgi:hypothetical protein